MKTLTTPKGGQVRVSEEVAVILIPLGYHEEPVPTKDPAPVSTPKKAPAKRTPRKTSTKKEV